MGEASANTRNIEQQNTHTAMGVRNELGSNEFRAVLDGMIEDNEAGCFLIVFS